MIDAELLRRDFTATAANLQRRGLHLNADEFGELEGRRKNAQQHAETLRAQRNQLSRSGEEAREQATALKSELRTAEADMHTALENMESYLLQLPNLLHDSTPDGHGESDNRELRRHGEPRQFDFAIKDHIALGAAAGTMDFDSAAAIASARFVILSGDYARLHRALAQFMLDLHIKSHNYREYYLPYLVNAKTLTGAGHLPKFADEVFATEKDNLYLIPTAEVTLVNLWQNAIIDARDLPLRAVAHTPCFRREAGSYGRDTRGMLRQHQFDKVELVQVRLPTDSYAGLEEMLGHAERVLQLLELPYRVMALCGGDIGFAAAKTYDIEVWMPGQNKYREISSCSNCEDFQARRMKTRYRQDGNKPALLHTLNGSGVAVGRALIALLENHQTADGGVTLPSVLAPYMDGQTQLAGGGA